MLVILTDTELIEAFGAAARRNDYHKQNRNKETYSRSKGKLSAFQAAWQGTMGELATAKFFGLKWTPFSRNWKKIPADVGGHIEVRATIYRTGDLLLHPKDKDARAYVLARLLPPNIVDLAGWMTGDEAKQEQFWQPATGNWRYPCYRVPQTSLHPIESLIEGEANGYHGDYRPPVASQQSRLSDAELIAWHEAEFG